MAYSPLGHLWLSRAEENNANCCLILKEFMLLRLAIEIDSSLQSICTCSYNTEYIKSQFYIQGAHQKSTQFDTARVKFENQLGGAPIAIF